MEDIGIGRRARIGQAALPQRFSAVFAERGRIRLPPLTRVDPHTTKRGVSMCPHFLASISCCWLLSQDRELCYSRLRVKEARSRRQIQNDKIYKGFSNRDITISYLYMNAPLNFFNEISMSKHYLKSTFSSWQSSRTSNVWKLLKITTEILSRWSQL